MKKTEVIELLKTIPDDEPLFLLRGEDRISPGLVRYYAGAAGARGASLKTVQAARDCEEQMRAWPERKWPK